MAIKDFYTENSEELGYNDLVNGMQPGHSISEGPGFDARVAVVKITDIHEAVSRINELNDTALLGADVTKKLYQVINTLKEAWKGTDATVHINNMIVWKSATASMSSVALEITSQAYQEIRKILLTIEANGGGAPQIGSFKTTSFGDSLKNGDDVVSTGEVFIDVVKAREALSTLRQVQSEFFEFYDRYSKQHNFMMEIWVSGGARDYHEDCFRQFKEQVELMRTEFEEAILTLDKAITNWEAV